MSLVALLAPIWAQAEIVVVGSDLLAPAIDPVLEAYAEHNEVVVKTEFIGSIPGVGELKSGAADLAILAAPEDTNLPVGDYKVIPIAYEVAYVVVDKLNPLTEISIDQLAAIFGTGSKSDYSRWGELGLQGPVATRSIQAMALDNEKTVVLELFKYRALDSGSLKPTVNRVNDNLQLTELVSSDSGSIGLTNKLILDDKLRALSVSGGKDHQYAFGPTPENVHYGDYPLRLGYYLVFPQSREQELLPLLRVLLGPDQAESLEKSGFVPVPENVRKRTLVELDKGV
ncbi:MAG: substrate-binding domain-containing protein [Verrucomicrobiota bacterium]